MTKNEKELEERFNASFYSEDLERYNPLPNYNVAPSHIHPVIVNLDQNHFRPLRWGLIPFWAKDVKISYRMINARLETITEKPAFRNAIQNKRCLVPFDGFYEWKRNGKEKTPFRIYTTNVEIFTIAGIWETWNSPDGETIQSFSLITQPANEFMKEIHDRMPAILLPEQEADWLSPDIKTQDALNLLNAFPPDLLKADQVSTRVNNVRNNDASLIEPVQ